jgi:chemotaxis-related protein WspD
MTERERVSAELLESVREATERVAAPRGLERARSESAFLFRIGSEWFALPTRVCERVVEESRTQSIPHRRGGVLLGIGSVAGDLMPVVSLSALLGVEQAGGADGARRTLLFTWKQARFALPVSEVYGVHRFHPDERQPTPATLPDSTAYTTAMLSWSDRMVGILDPERLHAGIARGIA